MKKNKQSNNADVRLKTLVKYKHSGLVLTARFGTKRFSRTKEQLVAIGAGDNTVLEDGFSVWVTKEQMERLK